MVARGESIGTLRLIDQLPSIGKLTGSAEIHVVVNRVHKSDKFPASFAGKSVAKTVGQALLEAGSPLPVSQLREDRSIEDCVRKGALLSEVPATMRVRRSFAKLARQLAA